MFVFAVVNSCQIVPPLSLSREERNSSEFFDWGMLDSSPRV